MKIALVTQWFDPEAGAAAIPGAMARALEKRGHEVGVVTGFPNYPSGRLYNGFKVRLHSLERQGAIQVHRVALYASHDRSPFRRAANYLSFMLSSSTVGVYFARRYQVALVLVSPATVGLAGVILHRLFRRPVVLYIQDLWPDSVLSTGLLNHNLEKPIGATLGWFCQKVYRSASRIAVVSPGYKQILVARGVTESKIDLIYNLIDEDNFYPQPSRAPASHFRLMYAGNLGDVQGLDTLVDAVATLHDMPDLEVVLVGSGVAEPALRALVSARGLEDRIHFAGTKAISEMSTILAQAHIQIVSLKDLPLFRVTVPSKVQSILACGLPMIVCAIGDAAELASSSGAGILVPPQDSQRLADAIRVAYSLKGEALEAMGRAGRIFYERELSSAAGARRLEESLVRACKESD